MSPSSVSADAFEARYRQSADPWNFAASPYEVGRYQWLLRALHQPTYRLGYEPGCSIGVLTRALASRTRRLVAIDIAQTAVTQAQQRCTDLSHVEISCNDVQTFRVPADPDLIVFSELGYYFSEAALSRIAAHLAAQLLPNGELIAAHWLGNSPDHVLHGDRVHEVLHQSLGLVPLLSERHEGFRLNSWRRS